MTLPTEFLRGRMGFSYLNTMDITELCATNISEYVEIAVRLGKDINFYNYIRTVIKDRAYLIWEDMEIPYRWSSILSTAVGLTPLSWDAFLFESGRNVALETSLREQRNKFREKRGYKEEDRKILHTDGHAPLEMECMEREGNEIFQCKQTQIFHSWYFGKEQMSRVRMEYLDYTLWRRKLMRTYQMLTRLGYLHFAYEYASTLLSHRLNRCLWEKDCQCRKSQCFNELSIGNDFEMLIDLGSLKYFMGNHAMAFRICKSVTDSINSSLANACVGVTGTYLDTQEVSLVALSSAWQGRYQFDKISSYIFQVPIISIVHNLLSGLNAFGKTNECISFGGEVLNISLMDPVGLWILSVSLLSWTSKNFQVLTGINRGFGKQFIVSSKKYDSFRSAIVRVQEHYQPIINVLFECCHKSEKLRMYMDKIANDIMDIVYLPRINYSMESVDTAVQEYGSKKKITLVTQYYHDRPYESDVEYALQKNLNNEGISNIVLLNEVHYDFSAFVNASKISSVIIGQ